MSIIVPDVQPFTRIPDALFDLLDARQLMLLGHYMREAKTAAGGYIFESLRYTAHALSTNRKRKFTPSMVVAVRQELIDMGYLRIARDADAGKKQPMMLTLNTKKLNSLVEGK
jgi:hypothetical protein